MSSSAAWQKGILNLVALDDLCESYFGFDVVRFFMTCLAQYLNKCTAMKSASDFDCFMPAWLVLKIL